jgi:DNA-binding beta-propeller fold protein YncE
MGLAVSDDTDRLYVSDNMQRAVFVFDFKKKQFWKYNDVGVPGGIALDAKERLYVVDMLGKSIRIFGPDRKLVSQIVDETVTKPTGIAVDKVNGKVYLVDTSNRDSGEMNVKVYDLQGKRIGQIGGKQGGAFGEFSYPTYATVDEKGYLYVSDTMNARVQKFDSTGKHVQTYGQMGSNWGEFDKPKGVAVDSLGNLYVVDSGWSNVQIFNERGQILLFFGGRGPVPGMLKNPISIAIDKNNRIYVGDYLNHRVEVYELVNTAAGDSFLKPPSNNPASKGK